MDDIQADTSGAVSRAMAVQPDAASLAADEARAFQRWTDDPATILVG